MFLSRAQEVVVIGGGYAGTLAAIRTAGRARRRANVTLVDPEGRLVHRLRLHQAAAGQDVPTHSLPKLTGRRVAHVKGTAHEIDAECGVVVVSGSGGRMILRFDHLVVAIGVDTVVGSRVASMDAGRLTLGDGSEVAFDVAVWCGGFVGHPLARDSALATDGRNRLVVDPTLRSVSHPHVLAVGDAAGIPAFASGAAFRMTCQAGMPSAAHAADTVAAAIDGREPEAFDFGYLHQPISLGRKDALIQFVDRADRPREKMLTGRRAALYKNVVTGSAVTGLKVERRLPGATRWPSGGAEASEPSPGLSVSPRG